MRYPVVGQLRRVAFLTLPMKNLLLALLLFLPLAGNVYAIENSEDSPTQTTVEVTPSTQPATTESGVIVQPPPTIKVTSRVNPKAVSETIKEWAAVLGVFAVVGVPAIILVLMKLGEIKAAAAKAFQKAEDQERKVAEIDATQRGQLLREGTGSGGPPTGTGGT